MTSKVDPKRFVALVRKYQDCEVLTDDMLYAFIEKVEVHAPTGGRTRYRQQRIDIYFNFIGEYHPPAEEISEEERVRKIDEQAEAKKNEKRQKSVQRYRERQNELKAAAQAGDPEAIAKLESERERKRLQGAKRRAELKAIREADPEYLRTMEEKERIRLEKMQEAERRKAEKQKNKAKRTRKELKALAEAGDPEAIAERDAMLAKDAEAASARKSVMQSAWQMTRSMPKKSANGSGRITKPTQTSGKRTMPTLSNVRKPTRKPPENWQRYGLTKAGKR